MKSSPPRVLTFDIETAFHIGGYFGPTYDVNIAKVIQKGYVLGFAWKYSGKPRIYSCYIWDFPRYKREPRNDIEVIRKWRKVMSDPTVHLVVGQTSISFDTKVMYGRLLIHNLAPLALPPQADTKKMVKSIARFDSNKLDDLAESFGYGKKHKTDADLWWDCMMGIKKAQKRMVEYNKRDVEITEKVYFHLLPHVTSHPNMAVIQGRPDACRHCGQNKGFIANGFDYTRTGKYRRWQCKNCRGNNRARKGEKIERPNNV
jgi:hypothetical protein